ncbi:MAG: glycosyltransferase [Kofleriaceae bacterium]
MTLRGFWVLVHALGTVVFINRYVGGLFVRLLGAGRAELTDESEPTVTVMIPLFNEGAGIQHTLHTVLGSDYPPDKLSVICIDDCSTDDSYQRARAIADTSGGRLTVMRNPTNLGKRASLIAAVRQASGDIVVSVDSDVIVDSAAIRELTRRFTDPRIAAVGGWVDVRNKHDNWLTRLQVIQYWYAYFVMRNVEFALRRVMNLSGCLTAYRRSVLLELEPILARRSILGVPIKYGEDRYLTRQIVKAGYLTTYTVAARCQTYVPTTLAGYFSQQLRWRRSNIVDYCGGLTHMWQLHPLIAINYFSMAVVMFTYPLAVYRALDSQMFLTAVAAHLKVLVIFGLYYRWRVRKWPSSERVGALSFLPQALVMPVTYALLAPLALFTLDSGSWETRSDSSLAGDTERAPQPVPQRGMAKTGERLVESGPLGSVLGKHLG